jgi:hypothetical protein
MISRYKQKICDLDSGTVAADKLLTFKDFNDIRFTFMQELFEHYRQLDDDFAKHLQGLESWHVWNIYK